MNSWPQLTSEKELDDVLIHSNPIILFKHSYRCSISSMAKNRLIHDMHDSQVDIFEIDVVRDRDVSLLIEDRVGVRHESPQVLLLNKGKVLYHQSHMAIRWDEIRDALASQTEL